MRIVETKEESKRVSDLKTKSVESNVVKSDILHDGRLYRAGEVIHDEGTIKLFKEKGLIL